MHGILFLLAERPGWFAEGRFLGKVLDEWITDAQEFVRVKLPHLVVLLAIAFVLIWLLRLITTNMNRVAKRHSGSASHIAQVRTLSGVIRNAGLATIWLITALQFFSDLGVNLAPLFASAGVVGIAIGFAAQNIVKDLLNGVLILLEDQFNVGDIVRLAGVAGTVEEMTLSKTTVRDVNGTLYVIPNSQITTVANLSRDYSIASVNVSVDFSANPDQVLALLKGIALEIRNSEEFRAVFVADPQVLGVDGVKGSEMLCLVQFKTLPNKQDAPVREFRRRVRLALEEEHLLPGDPNRIFHSFPEAAEAKAADPTTLVS
jgi:small conductance mechanosensitive channel